MDKIISIVIPTRNRQKIVMKVIDSILRINSKDFELIIQDNSDSDDLMHKISIFNDDRLKYNYTPETITFSDNFQKGFEHCSGKYVCFIGDDDGITPELIDLAFNLDRYNIDSMSFKNSVSFFWPGIEGLTDRINGTLQIGNINCDLVKYDVKEELDNLLSNGGQEYLKYGLPKIYHGIIKKEIIDQAIEKYDNCFDSLSPDIYSTVILSQFIGVTYVTDYPFTIAGSCSYSASAASITKKHVGKLEDAPHFRGFKDYEWSNEVPKFYSVETIWAESLIYALNKINDAELTKKFNTKRMMQKCLNNHPGYRSIILDCAKTNNIILSYYDVYVSRFIISTIKNIKRIITRLEIIFGLRMYKKESKIIDMGEAISFVENYLKNNKVNQSNIFRDI